MIVGSCHIQAKGAPESSDAMQGALLAGSVVTEGLNRCQNILRGEKGGEG